MTRGRLFLFSLTALIAGISAASHYEIPGAAPSALAAAGIVLTTLFWFHARNDTARRVLWTVGILLIVLGVGMERYRYFETRAMAVSGSLDTVVTLYGNVAAEPSVTLRSSRVLLGDIRSKQTDTHTALTGRILVIAAADTEVRYGESLSVTGTLEPLQRKDASGAQAMMRFPHIVRVESLPCDGFVACARGTVLQSIHTARARMLGVVQAITSEPYSALLAGILIGDRSGIPASVIESFRTSGILHILAISGYNISVLAAVAFRLLKGAGLPRRTNFFAVLGLISIFIVLTGASASVVRAGIMGILVLFAYEAGRLYSVHNALVGAAAVMVWINPYLLRWDAGFQLSFLATMGIVYLSPLIAPFMRWLPSALQIRETVLMTLSAQLAVLPLLLYAFGEFPLVAPLTNIAVLLVIPLTMGLGAVAVAAGFVSFTLGSIAALPVSLLLRYEIFAAAFFSRLPLASFAVPPLPLTAPLLAYLVLAFVVRQYYRKQKLFSRPHPLYEGNI